MPLLFFDVHPASGTSTSASAPTAPGTGSSTTLVSHRLREGSSDDSTDKAQKRGWLTYLPLGVLFFILFIPHPSYIITLSSFYLRTRHAPWRFAVHLLAVHVLTLGALTSLVVCVVRDPGGVGRERNGKSGRRNKKKIDTRAELGQKKTTRPYERVADTEDGVTTSLLGGGAENYDGEGHDAEHEDVVDGYDVQGEDLVTAEEGEGAPISSSLANSDVDSLTLNGRWCTRCRHARPERAHHCGACGRCVLKMDHHCPWLGGNCVGHRTYPAFLHFLLMVTLLAAYIACVAVTVVVSLISDPFEIDPHTSPLHPLFLLLMGTVFTLTMGSFLAYHIYLVSTNQTTLEHMSPYLLLRYLPPPPLLEPPQPYEIPPYTPYGSRQSQIYVHMAQPPLVDSSTHSLPVIPESPLPLRPLHFEPNNSDATVTPTATTRNLDTTLAYHPPDEHDLSQAQRRVVMHVHGQVRLYDLGWRRNWGEVLGGGGPKYQSDGYRNRYGVGREWWSRRGNWWGWWWWLGVLVLSGGRPKGDGRSFERGKKAREGLGRLLKGLEDVRRSEGRGWKWEVVG